MRLGAHVEGGSTHFAVRAHRARAVWLCLFSEDGAERRVAMAHAGDVWTARVPGDLGGCAYGYRAEGDWAPEQGLWFDPAKLLVDPYAVELDRRFIADPLLAEYGAETGGLVPHAIVPRTAPALSPQPPRFTPGGLIYEINVRGFTMLHPDIPASQRGTIAALGHPAVIAHLQKLHVAAIELMPIVAWIDERHLPPLGLSNAWGYNPVALMAIDPGLAPGGVVELREAVSRLHAAGIGVILDLVFNHTGESDAHGPVLSLRGLDDAAYARAPDGALINDAGTGNTLDFANPAVRDLTRAAMRHFVQAAGVDGFRLDLAPILARGPGFSRDAPIFAEIAADPVLADRVMIAEPWDIGPGGYQLGAFPPNWLEWNDRFRDDVRRFWRGDGALGALATRLAGSADIFGEGACRSVNMIAAHDGFTLADTVAYAERHNEANGEGNRDGHAENYSWNNGAEGPSADPEILARRGADSRALLATLFASTGTIMLTAGDEFGRSQRGNNNAYAQNNPLTWIDWAARDLDLERYVANLAAWRAARSAWMRQFPQAGDWLRIDTGAIMTTADWEDPTTPGFIYRSADPAAPYEITVDRRARCVSIRDRA